MLSTSLWTIETRHSSTSRYAVKVSLNYSKVTWEILDYNFFVKLDVGDNGSKWKYRYIERLMVLDNSWNWRFPVGFSSVNARNWKSCLNRFTLSSSWKPYPHNSFKFCLWLIFHGSFKVLIFQYLWFQILVEISYLEGKNIFKIVKKIPKTVDGCLFCKHWTSFCHIQQDRIYFI